MTTVAALARDGHVAMAADTRTQVYDRPIVDAARKIRRYPLSDGSEVLIGISGTGALATVMDADLNLVDLDLPKPDYLDRWANEVARKLSAVAVAAHVADDGKLDGVLLLGYSGRLWTMVHCYAIPHPDGIAAIGSGEGPAVGAIDAMLGFWSSPVEILHRALEIAIARGKHSGAPIQVEHLPPVAA